MRKFGYFLYSKVDDYYYDQLGALIKMECSQILFDSYTGIDGQYKELDSIFDECDPGDMLILRSLDQICLSEKQLSFNIERLRKNNLHLYVIAQNSIDTEKYGREEVYSFILEFCDLHFACQSHSLLQRNYAYLTETRYKYLNLKKIATINKCFLLSKKGKLRTDLAEELGVSLTKVEEYVKLYDSGELKKIERILLKRANDKPKKNPYTEKVPITISTEEKIVAWKVKILNSYNVNPRTIRKKLNITKGIYDRYSSIDFSNY